MNEVPVVRNRRSGATLIVVMVLTLLGTLVASSVAFSTGQRVWLAYRQVNLEQAFYLAAAGAERAATRVAAGNETSGTISANLGKGSYSTDIKCTTGAGEVQIDITSLGTVAGVSRTVTVHGLRRVSWARYALWYDSANPEGLVMAVGELFDGRVYAKPQLIFSNANLITTPAPGNRVHFFDRVWSGASSIKVDPGADPIFDLGIVYNAAVETMATVNFADLQAKAAANGLVLEGNTTIVIDGSTLKITNTRKGWTAHTETIPASNKALPSSATPPLYYTIYVKTSTSGDYSTKPGDVTVSAPNGLGNRLTIIADRDIKIVNHIKYANDPLVDTTSTDALGLIAKRDVVVQPPITMPDNFVINAHIMCQNGGFGVLNYASMEDRGKLTVFGGIVNKIRNGVGTTEPRGYKKNYIFDKRFSKNPPPNYPVLTDELEWSEWEG